MPISKDKKQFSTSTVTHSLTNMQQPTHPPLIMCFIGQLRPSFISYIWDDVNGVQAITWKKSFVTHAVWINTHSKTFYSIINFNSLLFIIVFSMGIDISGTGTELPCFQSISWLII